MAGARVDIISPQQGKVKGWNHTEWGDQVSVDRPLDGARADDYDALLLPGGVMNPDYLRANDSRPIREGLQARNGWTPGVSWTTGW